MPVEEKGKGSGALDTTLNRGSTVFSPFLIFVFDGLFVC
jgi:hypothetical protein